MRRSGFTLLEVLLALGLLAGAILALAHLVIASASAAGDTRRSDLASVLAQERMEQLRALAWGYEADGAPREDLRSSLAGDPDAGGPGLGLSPPDALERDSPGFVDYTDASGQRVAAASMVGVAFVRRWLVRACTGCGAEGLVLRVLVIRPEARLHGAPHHSRGAVTLTTIKARRTW